MRETERRAYNFKHKQDVILIFADALSRIFVLHLIFVAFTVNFDDICYPFKHFFIIFITAKVEKMLENVSKYDQGTNPL